MLDLIIKNCTPPDGRTNIDIGVAQSYHCRGTGAKADAGQSIDAAGQLVSSPLSTRTFIWTHAVVRLPRVNQSGIAGWKASR